MVSFVNWDVKEKDNVSWEEFLDDRNGMDGNGGYYPSGLMR